MIADRRSMQLLDAVGRRYGARPSALVGEDDALRALCIDLWAFSWGTQLERRGGR